MTAHNDDEAAPTEAEAETNCHFQQKPSSHNPITQRGSRQ